MEQTDKALAGAIEAVSSALTSAADTYGEATVDLALLAVQFEAMGGIGMWMAAVVFAPFCVRMVRRLIRCANDTREVFYDFASMAAAALTILVVGFALVGVPSPAKVAAAFGYPEILIATNALKVAGLL